MTPRGITASGSSARADAQSLGFVVGIGLGVVTAFCFVAGVAAGPEGPPISLAGTLNPNTAPLVSLVRLPRVGPSRAWAIVAFRDRCREETGRDVPFRCPDDLQQITGIGPKTVEDIAGWLRFAPPDGEPTGEGHNSPSQR